METPFKPKNVVQLAILPLVLLVVVTLQLSKNISFKKSEFVTTPIIRDVVSNTSNNDHLHNHQPPPPSRRNSTEKIISTSSSTAKCDLSTGEWVRDVNAPYYTNHTCEFILEHQNCMKYGRPDTDFLKWRWQPDGCKLPVFNPYQFFAIVRHKSLAFIGDSLARNQMESLLCLLSRVEYPYDASDTENEDYKRWHFKNHNFTVSIFTSPFLVRHKENDAKGPTGTGIFGLYLDEADGNWKTQVDKFDYILLSAGQWFLRSMMYYENRTLIGCRYCEIPDVKDLPMIYGYQNAFRTAFRTILERPKFKGVVYLRTFAPSHFEGEWNKGGDCPKQKPYKSSQVTLEGTNMDMYIAQLEEFKVAKKLGRKRGMRFRLMDVTQPMLMRPDGHPSRYGHWPNDKVTLHNDCVHWCLPGPIDTWNDFLLEMIRTEGVKAKEENMVLHPVKS